MANLDVKDMQGFLLSSYAKNMPCANYILLEVTDAAKAKKWLGEMRGYITSGEDRKTDFCLNIAFTAEGFRKFGFAEEKLGTFSVAFQEGMATPTRQQILGDYDNNDPKKWTWGGLEKPLDILLLLFTKNEDELKSRVQWVQEGIAKYGGLKTIISNLHAGRQPDTREHFGFLDGVGQPVMEGTGQKERQLNRTGHATVVKAGEFVLGYENEMQKIDPLPESSGMPDFGRNGTYLVFRQLEQHVSTFWKYLRDTTANEAGEADQAAQEKLAAKMIGRWRSGAPITTFPHADPASSEVNEENNFGYAANDLAGTGCPIGAHIRRTNPRDSLFENTDASLLTVKRHRIMRRGRSYGCRAEDVYKDDDIERGLHFICLNSNIERQFEFIQQSWVNNPNFDNLNHETDPLIGSRVDHNMFSIQGCPARTRVHQLANFVTTKGGAYFFLPGVTALAHLAED
jgi:Dyp-type peroxidase family